MREVPIFLAAISPDSTKVALTFHIRMGDNQWDHLVYVVEVGRKDEGAYTERFRNTVGIYADKERVQAIVGENDCLFGFSPDSRQLAVSSQKTARHNKRDAIHIRMLDVIPMHVDQRHKWLSFACDESFNETPYRVRFLGYFPITTYPRLVFGVWENRWVAGVSEKSRRTLLLYDMHSHSRLASFELSCLDAFGSGMKGTIFSDGLSVAARCTRPASTILRKLKRGEDKTSDSRVIFAVLNTNQVICTLKRVFDDYWLSSSGQYAILRKKKELRLFRLSEY